MVVGETAKNAITSNMKTIAALLLVLCCGAVPISCCVATNLEVGVCLHVYLERDFLSLENIVYPPQPESFTSDRYRYDVHGSNLQRGWFEGPELEDYCKKLRDVVQCFEDILVTCHSARDFFRFRHLLHSLDVVHQFLCSTPDSRKHRFVEFLRAIECAEKARRLQRSCQRHNVTMNVWNKILRLEVGSEICDSLNTQRACLLENNYLHDYCTNQTRIDMYTHVSGLFLSTWCKIPLLPGVGNIPHSMTGQPSVAWSDHSAAAHVTVTEAALTIIMIMCFLLLSFL